MVVDNVWEEVVATPWKIEPFDGGVAALAVRRSWALGDQRLRLGVEASALVHWGTQDHVEVALPVVAEYRPSGEWAGPLRGLGFGLGLSWASAPPQVETRRGGATEPLLLHWLVEAEFASPWPDTSVVLRLHHRSDGFGLLDVDTGSNAVMLGLRRAF